MSGIFVLLGTNLGDRIANLSEAISRMSAYKINVLRQSSIYESAPWGINDQPWFLNLVVEIETTLEANELLEALLQIETEMGRYRKQKWGPRLIDLDILYYGEQLSSSDTLHLPHPGIPNRRFTLMPLVELAPDFVHPRLKLTQSEMLAVAPDDLPCHVSDLSLMDELP